MQNAKVIIGQGRTKRTPFYRTQGVRDELQADSEKPRCKQQSSVSRVGAECGLPFLAPEFALFPSSRHTYGSPAGDTTAGTTSTTSTTNTAATATTTTAVTSTGPVAPGPSQTGLAADLALARLAPINTPTRQQTRDVDTSTSSPSTTLHLSVPDLFSAEVSRDLSGVIGAALLAHADTSFPNTEAPRSPKRHKYEAGTGRESDAPAAKRLHTASAPAWLLPGPSSGFSLSGVSHAATSDVTGSRTHPEDRPSTRAGRQEPFDTSENSDFLAWSRATLGIAPIVQTGKTSLAAAVDRLMTPSNELPCDRGTSVRCQFGRPALPRRDTVAAAPETHAVDMLKDDGVYNALSDLAAGRTDSLKCRSIKAYLTSAPYVEARRLLERLIDRLETSHQLKGSWLSAFEALHGWSVAFEARSEQALSAALLSTGDARQEQVRSLARSATRTRFDGLTSCRLHAMSDMPPQKRATEWNGLLASLQRCRDTANTQTILDLTNFIERLPEDARLPSARAILALDPTVPKPSYSLARNLFAVLGNADRLSLADHCLEEPSAPAISFMVSILKQVADELPHFPAEDASRLMQRIADLTTGQTEESWALQLDYYTQADIIRALTSASEDDERAYKRPDFDAMKREWTEEVARMLED